MILGIKNSYLIKTKDAVKQKGLNSILYENKVCCETKQCIEATWYGEKYVFYVKLQTCLNHLIV